MARTETSRLIEQCENRIALASEIDECLRFIALRTDDPLLIEEVERGRSTNDKLWLSLITERRQLTNKEHIHDY